MSKTVSCAVVQGNIRRGAQEVLACLSRQFDYVILSTWDDESPENIPKGDFELILNGKPPVAGYSHRNYQRLGTAAGLDRAQELGATHVLKWRTDMLPTKMDVGQLLKWAHYKVPDGVQSRLVTCAFRNLTVREDWFSSMPDLFAFAHIDMMQLLWGAESFDYTRQMNVPAAMAAEYGIEWAAQPDAGRLYAPESELYAIFRSRLQGRLDLKLSHAQIAMNYLRIIDHDRLGICWFSTAQGFRSIMQALHHPWWTESTWQHGNPVIYKKGYPSAGMAQKLRKRLVTPLVTRCSEWKQRKWYKEYHDQAK